MDEGEIRILILSGIASGMFFFAWYSKIFAVWPRDRGKPAKTVLGLLPAVAFSIFVYTLTALAASDVVNDPFYIIFYILMGFAWLYLGVFIMSYFLDLSWVDDILNMNNNAALLAVAGGFLGLTVIYAAANIGEGPGWWCVVFAGSLGLVSWTALALFMNLLTQASERITVGRDVSCGLRTGCFLFASGIILGRASAGDWTSLSATVLEFATGWPALPLTAAAIIGEKLFAGLEKDSDAFGSGNFLESALWGTLLIGAAIVSVIIFPQISAEAVRSFIMQPR